MKIMNDSQMELSFSRTSVCRSQARRQQRQARAAAWFRVLRQVVDRATDWQPAPPPRPVQTFFAPCYPAVSVHRGCKRQAA